MFHCKASNRCIDVSITKTISTKSVLTHYRIAGIMNTAQIVHSTATDYDVTAKWKVFPKDVYF